jgi:hypothetical protein
MLERIFDFTQADLRANQDGELSERQLQEIRRDRFSRSNIKSSLILGLIIGAVFFGCTFVVLAWQAFWQDELPSPYQIGQQNVLPISLVVFLVFGGLFFSFGFYRDTKIKHIDGPFELVKIDTINVLRVGDVQFTIVPEHVHDIQTWLKLNGDLKCRVYYCGGKIMSIDYRPAEK